MQCASLPQFEYAMLRRESMYVSAASVVEIFFSRFLFASTSTNLTDGQLIDIFGGIKFMTR